MQSTCFPEQEICPVEIPLATSTILQKSTKLSEQDECWIERFIECLPVEDDVDTSVCQISDRSLTASESDIVSFLEPLIEDGETSHDELGVDICLELNTNADHISRPPTRRKTTTSEISTVKKARVETQNVQIVRRVSPYKPTNDNNEYRVITLSNGLNAVLIRKESVLPQRGKLNEQIIDLLDELQSAYEADQKFHEQNLLPTNFPKSFPLVSPSIPKIISKIIERQVESEKTDGTEYFPDIQSYSLASDDSQEKCSIAVTVNVGTTDDPKDCLGLAHFLEHMVHYGSKKYPGEEEYVTFIKKHGSDFNAFTENNTTTYYSTLPMNVLEIGMDMIGSMLSKPLFERDMTLREVNAVDSEFHLKKHVVFLRRWYVLQHAFNGHPLGKFGCGNKDTLLESKNIHRVIQDFHAKYYVASSMTVGLESTLSLADQEELILKYFSSLPKGNRKILRETPPSERNKSIRLSNMHYVVQGLCSISNLWIVWPISEEFVKDRGNKSMSVLLKVLNDSGEESLSHYLKKQGYIWLMYCNIPIDALLMDNKYTTFLTMDLFLTPKGEANVNDIMEATFSYIKQLKKIQDSSFRKEFHKMKLYETTSSFNMSSFFRDSGPIHLSKELQYVNPEDILKDDRSRWKEAAYQAGQVHTLLGHLRQENMIVIQTISSKTKLEEYVRFKKVQNETYTNAQFVLLPVTESFGDLEKKHSTMHKFPDILREDSNLSTLMRLTEQHGRIEAQEIAIRSLWGVKVLRCIHMGNAAGNTLSVCLVNYGNSDCVSSAKNFAYSLLWVTSVYLEMMTGNKSSPKVIYFLVPHQYGISIGIFCTGARKLLQSVEALNKEFFTKPISEKNLAMAKQALKNIYDLFLATNAEFITQDLLHFVTCNHSGDMLSNALSHISDCSLNDVNYFSQSFKTKTMAFVIAIGNVPVSGAEVIIDTINKQGEQYVQWFSIARFMLSEYFQTRKCYAHTSPIATGERCIRLKSDLNYSFTTTVKNFYFVGVYDPSKYTLWMKSLLHFHLRAFVNLRMKNQLGYWIQVYFPKPQKDQPMMIGVGVTATASKFTACSLDKYLDQFMVDYGKYLKSLTEKTFSAVKNKTKGKLDDAAACAWYRHHFGKCFASSLENKYALLGLSKISIQIEGNDSKSCNCERCQEIHGWKRDQFWNHFQLAQGKQSRRSTESYFVDDLRKIRNGA